MSLELDDIYPILKSTFPVRNDFYPCSYTEELVELLHFGIDSKEKLSELVSKHKEILLEEDAMVELEGITYDFFCDEMGKDVVNRHIEEGFWYSYPALLRLSLEKEFGESYDEYAYSRDGLKL